MNATSQAFPGIEGSHAAGDSHGNPYTGLETYPGMTKREFFAAMALQGVLSCHTLRQTTSPEMYAIMAVNCADALLKQLEAIKPEEK